MDKILKIDFKDNKSPGNRAFYNLANDARFRVLIGRLEMAKTTQDIEQIIADFIEGR